jgi:hypothetical protein
MARLAGFSLAKSFSLTRKHSSCIALTTAMFVNVTLMGKISYKISCSLKIVHLLTELPNLAQSRLNKLTSLFYNLIWNNKPDRVKRNTLIGDITQGGLNMIHIHSFNIYVCGFASLRQSKTSLQKLTEISLSFFFL